MDEETIDIFNALFRAEIELQHVFYNRHSRMHSYKRSFNTNDTLFRESQKLAQDWDNFDNDQRFFKIQILKNIWHLMVSELMPIDLSDINNPARTQVFDLIWDVKMFIDRLFDLINVDPTLFF